MEGLIFMVVVFLISTLFGKGKKEQPQKPMPPFSNQKAPTKPQPAQAEMSRTQSLEDFAKGIFSQLSEKAETEAVSPIPEAEKEVAVAQEEPRRKMRPALAESRPIVQAAKKQRTLQVPRTQKDMMQAVMMAEVLGPPKAKQRK